jgi:hypothetical protein
MPCSSVLERKLRLGSLSYLELFWLYVAFPFLCQINHRSTSYVNVRTDFYCSLVCMCVGVVLTDLCCISYPLLHFHYKILAFSVGFALLEWNLVVLALIRVLHCLLLCEFVW